MDIKDERPRVWVCWDCDAGDHFLCHVDSGLGCQCACRDGSDAYFVAIMH